MALPQERGQERPDSAAFDDDGPDEPMSVVVARSGRAPEEILVGYQGFGVVALRLSDLESAGQELLSDPLPDEPDHALVRGRKTLGIRRAMAKGAHWVVRPPGAYAPRDDT